MDKGFTTVATTPISFNNCIFDYILDLYCTLMQITGGVKKGVTTTLSTLSLDKTAMGKGRVFYSSPSHNAPKHGQSGCCSSF